MAKYRSDEASEVEYEEYENFDVTTEPIPTIDQILPPKKLEQRMKNWEDKFSKFLTREDNDDEGILISDLHKRVTTRRAKSSKFARKWNVSFRKNQTKNKFKNYESDSSIFDSYSSSEETDDSLPPNSAVSENIWPVHEKLFGPIDKHSIDNAVRKFVLFIMKYHKLKPITDEQLRNLDDYLNKMNSCFAMYSFCKYAYIDLDPNSSKYENYECLILEEVDQIIEEGFENNIVPYSLYLKDVYVEAKNYAINKVKEGIPITKLYKIFKAANSSQ